MALYDTYGKQASAVRQLSQVTPPNPEPKAPEPKPKGFDRKVYQRDLMRQRRRRARAAKA